MYLDVLELVGKLNRLPDGFLSSKEKIYITNLIQQDVKAKNSNLSLGNTRRKDHQNKPSQQKTKNGWGNAKSVLPALSKRIGVMTKNGKSTVISKKDFLKILEQLDCPLELAVEAATAWGRIEVLAGGLRYKINPLKEVVAQYENLSDAEVAEKVGCSVGRVWTIRNNR